MKLSVFFVLLIVFSFINDLRIPLGGCWSVPVGVLFIYISLFLLLIFNYKSFLKNLIHIARNRHNSFWVYMLFFIYILSLTLIQGIFGITKMPKSVLATILLYGGFLLPGYITSIYASYKMIPLEKLIKLIYIIYYAILLLGIVDFIAYYFDIVPIQKILSSFFNTQTVALNDSFIKPVVNGLPRVQSIYFEAGFFAQYTFLMLPILYNLSLSPYNIFNNKYFNFFIKKTTIPLIWINLILTQSPIWLIFSGISTVIFFVRKLFINFKGNPKKYLKFLFISIMIVLIALIPISKIDIQKTYLKRISIVKECITDINLLIYAEPSLGTRLSNIIALIDIGLESPIWGVGYSNLEPRLTHNILNKKTPVLITEEMHNMILKKVPSFQNPPLTNIFVKYGLIALLLYYAFIFKTIYALNKCRKYNTGSIQAFNNGLIGTLISSVIMSCYDITVNNILCAVLIGISIGFIQYTAEHI